MKLKVLEPAHRAQHHLDKPHSALHGRALPSERDIEPTPHPATAAAAAPPHFAYLPALDGLRALAVLGVMLFHDGRLVGGYLGVDLFFVLSGFLITSLLLTEWRATARIDLRAFWVRRARRLFPALGLLVVAVIVYAFVAAQPTELARIRGDGLATLAYGANWHAIGLHDDYWTHFGGRRSPLEHTWSLSIEEQFYLAWPLLTYALLRLTRGSRRALFAVCATLAVASALAMALWYAPEDTSRAYMGTETRTTAIVLGAALACVLSGHGSWRRPLVWALDGLGLLALGGLAVAWVMLGGEDAFLYRGGFWLTQLGVLVLIACATQTQSLLARALAWRPLIAIGRISYGLYLWHWPIFVLLDAPHTGLDALPLSALRYAVTFAVAIASYVWVEKPIRTRGLRFGRPIVVLPAVAGLLVAGLLVATREPAAASAGPVAQDATRILIVGDSLAGALSQCMRPLHATRPVAIAGQPGGCNILSDQFRLDPPQGGGDCDLTWQVNATALAPDVTLVVLGGGYFAGAKIDGRLQKPCDDGWTREYTRELQKQLRMLTAHSVHVAITTAPYYVGRDAWLAGLTSIPRMDCYNRTVRAAVADVPGVTLIDLSEKVCPGGVCIGTQNGAPVREDGLHFSRPGCNAVAQWVLDRALDLAAPAP